MKKLSPEKELELFAKYRNLKNKIQWFTLSDKSASKELKSICSYKIKNNQSLAKLANDYSNKVKGRNKYLSRKVKECLNKNSWDSIILEPTIIKQLEEHIEDKDILHRVQGYNDECQQIETQIIETFKPLTIHIAKQHSSKTFGIDIKDIIQECTQGILRAMEKYDLSYGVRFMTYAYISATDKVKGYIMAQSRLVKLPKSKLEKIFQIIEASNTIPNSKNATMLTLAVNRLKKKKLKRKLSPEEMFTEEEVEGLITLLHNNPLSLDYPIQRDTLKDFIPDPIRTDQRFDLEEDNNQLKIVLQNLLDDMEYTVIYYKYLHSGDEISIDKVKDILLERGQDLSRERINQYKRTALAKLKDDENFKEIISEFNW